MAGETESGLASVVTSAPGSSPNSASMASRMRTRSSAPRRVGVPPPTKTVATGRSSRTWLRAQRISEITVSAYVDLLAPAPSSSAV